MVMQKKLLTAKVNDGSGVERLVVVGLLYYSYCSCDVSVTLPVQGYL